MKLPLYQIDAFASRIFAGNPAAVCPLDTWLDDDVMQSIAAENNLAETAFFVPGGDGYRLRWFTPVAEVDLCGHATLAAGFVVFRYLRPEAETVTFDSRSGPLTVTREADRLTLDFPALPVSEPLPPEELRPVAAALGAEPLEVRRGMDLMAVFATEAEVQGLQPDMALLSQLETRGVIATAPGEEVDFVSRFFAPALGIPEDPVTGSAHCALAPYWAPLIGKVQLMALQLSPRGGELLCEVAEERVRISGSAVLYLEGTIHV
jgi:PhzF family phenazine biosynthesis protein